MFFLGRAVRSIARAGGNGRRNDSNDPPATIPNEMQVPFRLTSAAVIEEVDECFMENAYVIPKMDRFRTLL